VAGVFLSQQVKPYRVISAIDPSNPVRRNYEEFVRLYQDENKLHILVQFDQKIPTSEMILAVKKLRQRLETIRYIDEISEINNATYPSVNGNSFKFVPFVSNRGLISSRAENILRHSPFDSLYLGRSHNSYLLNIVFKKEMPKKIGRKIMAEITHDLEDMSSDIDAKYFILGDLFQQSEFQTQIQKNNIKVLPFFILAIVLAFYFFFRSYGVALLALFIIGVCYISTVLFIAWWESALSPLGSMSLFFVFIISTSDLVHYFTSLQKNPNAGGHDVFKPCILTSITTFVGFSSLILSDLIPVRDFGMYCCMGIVVGFLTTFYLLPLLIEIFNVKVPTTDSRSQHLAPYRLLCFVQRFKLYIVIFFLGMAGTSSFFLNKTFFEHNFLQMFSQKHLLSRSVKVFKQEFGFSGNLELIIHAPEELLNSVEGRSKLSQIDKAIRDVPNVVDILSAHSLLLFLENGLGLGNSQSMQVFTGMREVGIFSNLFPLFRNETRWIVRLASLDSKDLLKTENAINEIFTLNKDNNELRPEITGYAQVRLAVTKMVFESFFKSLGLTFIGIFLCFWIYFKSFKFAVLGMIPNIFPIMAIYGLAGYFRIPIDYNLVILNSAVLGIGVDDTIHFLHFFKEESWRGSIKAMVKRSVFKTYSPLTKTTYLFLLAFPAFFLTEFRLFHQISLFLMFGLGLALLADIVFMPALLLCLSKQRLGKV